MDAGWQRARKWGVISAAVLAALAAGLWVSTLQQPALDDYGPMPAFSLIDQAERPVASTGLKGKVLLFSFIYTQCPDICPTTMLTVRGLQQAMAQAGLTGRSVELVTITVDPEYDTPVVLARYAAQYGADLTNWRLLTGEPGAVRQAVVEGFKLGTEKVAHQHGPSHSGHKGYAVMHTDRLVLVDRSGRIRAMYHVGEADTERIIADIRSLL